MSQFDYGNALGPEEEEQGDDPEPDGDTAIGGDAGDNVQVEYGNHEEQHQIEAAEYALEVRWSGLGVGGQSGYAGAISA